MIEKGKEGGTYGDIKKGIKVGIADESLKGGIEGGIPVC
jgi:hypothetical protein